MHTIGINPISIWFSKFTRFKNHTNNLLRRICNKWQVKIVITNSSWKINELIFLIPPCYQPQMVFRRLVGSMWICGHCKNHWHSCLHEFYYYIHNTKMYTRWVVGYFACVCLLSKTCSFSLSSDVIKGRPLTVFTGPNYKNRIF